MEVLHYFLDVEISYSKHVMHFSQLKYVYDLLVLMVLRQRDHIVMHFSQPKYVSDLLSSIGLDGATLGTTIWSRASFLVRFMVRLWLISLNIVEL